MNTDLTAPRQAMVRTQTLRGARFYRTPGHADDCAGPDDCDCQGLAVVMFVNNLDAGTRVGPREATDRDAEDHPAAFAKFQAEDAAIQAGRLRAPGVELADEPLRPLVVWVDPPDYEKPPREKGLHERRRDDVLARARARAGDAP